MQESLVFLFVHECVYVLGHPMFVGVVVAVDDAHVSRGVNRAVLVAPDRAVVVFVSVLNDEERQARHVGQVTQGVHVGVTTDAAVDVSELGQCFWHFAVVFAEDEVNVGCGDVVSPATMFG